MSKVDVVANLVSRIDLYLDEKMNQDELEQFTLSLISSDEFDILPSQVQDVIYTLDNAELNKLDRDDIIKLRDELAALAKQL